jgi:hypothetical protein
MPRAVSLNARMSIDAAASGDVEVVLIRITHPDMDEVVRLSTDPTVRIDGADPVVYGTLSTWMTGDGSPFLFCLVSAVTPDDKDDSPPQAALMFDNVDQDIGAVLRGFVTPATCDMAVVLAATPNRVEAEWQGFQIMSAGGDAGTISLTISQESIAAEPWPAGRMTRQRFPGLFK